MGAAISGLLLHLGDRLGLYKAMAGAGPITSESLARRTGTAERLHPVLVLLCLPLTFLFGPAGLLLFFVLRAVAGRVAKARTA